VISRASNLVGFNFTSQEQLNKYVFELQQSGVGFFEKMWNMFSLVNVMWTFAVVGITITFIPTMLHIFGPVAKEFCSLIYNIALILWPYVEQIGYFTTVAVLSQTIFVNKYVGYYVGLLSLFCYYAMIVVSVIKHKYDSPIVYVICAVPTAMLTLYYNSNFMGFATVSLVYLSLGFFVASSTLCIVIGFDSKLATSRCVATSMMLVPMYYHISTHTDELKYFKYGVYVLGPIVYFLGLLISTELERGPAHLIMIGSLLGTLYVSSVIANICLYNVALTFSILYAFMTVGRMLSTGNMVVAYFAICVGLYYASLYLTTHPEFLTSILYGEQ